MKFAKKYFKLALFYLVSNNSLWKNLCKLLTLSLQQTILTKINVEILLKLTEN